MSHPCLRVDTTVAEEGEKRHSWVVVSLLFGAGLAGVLISSEWILVAAPIIAEALGVPSVIGALTVVALGTSIPEIATCIIAAHRGEGGLAAGNILGADILNICWIAGASAMVNPLNVGIKVINFMFPSMLIIVFAMLAFMRAGYRPTSRRASFCCFCVWSIRSFSILISDPVRGKSAGILRDK